MEKQVIRGKPVYVFESHNEALWPWAEMKSAHPGRLILITLDHHTDTKLAFLTSNYVYDYAQGNLDKSLERIAERVAQIDPKREEDIKQAVADLRNDEQIDAAIRLGLFEFAFCFNNKNKNTRSTEEEEYFADDISFLLKSPPQPPFTYAVPDRNIYEIAEPCAVGCNERCHGDECDRKQADQVLESVMLNELITKANRFAEPTGIQSITGLPYVLDIDLDYFRSVKGLAPEDPQTFYGLVRNANGITIATEPKYVEGGRIDSDLTSQSALQKMLQHIEKALA